MPIQNNIDKINARIADYCARYHRESPIQLLAASKTQSPEHIREAFHAGVRLFGENYLQEALEKFPALSDLDIEWHFIGPIQSNKIKKIAENFAWVQSVSSIKIAQGLNDKRPDDLPPLNICIEVNVSSEKTKSGVLPEDVLSFAAFCQKLPRLTLRGLMTIPKPTTSFEEQRTELRSLKKIYDELNTKHFNLDTLSMGMSDDLEAAIAEGATMARVGTAIFGPRNIRN